MHTFIGRLDYEKSLAVALSKGKYPSDLFQLWTEVIRKEGGLAPEENLGHKNILILSKDKLQYDGKIFSYKEEEIKIPEYKFNFDQWSRMSVTTPPIYNCDHGKVILFIYL